jgi:CRISPR-associated protein Cas5d
MKVERVSYDVMTPSAARGILEAIYWKPGVRWIVDGITVRKPIRFVSVRRNELAGRVPVDTVKAAMRGGEPPHTSVEDHRQQRSSLILRDVDYLIDAHFALTGEDDNQAKHIDTFRRRARGGRCHHQPYFGTREFPAYFELVEGDRPVQLYRETRDLGWMLYDLDFSAEEGPRPRFFFARMVEGFVNLRDVETRE